MEKRWAFATGPTVKNKMNRYRPKVMLRRNYLSKIPIPGRLKQVQSLDGYLVGRRGEWGGEEHQTTNKEQGIKKQVRTHPSMSLPSGQAGVLLIVLLTDNY